MSTTVAQARVLVRRATRNGSDDSMFKAIDVDRAILLVGRRFAQQTKCLLRGDDVAIASGNATFPISGTLVTAGFTPDQLLDVSITAASGVRGGPLELIGWPELNERAYVTSSGIPCYLAFAGRTGNGTLWPTPNQAYTAKLRWWEPFTSWQPGDDAASNTLLNLTDEWLDPILQHGAPAMLINHLNEKGVQSDRRWALYLAAEKSQAGAGSVGVQVLNRTHWRDSGRSRRPFPVEGGYNP